MADAREGARWFYTHRVDAPGWASTPSIGSSASPRAFGADGSEPRFNLPIAGTRPVGGRPRPSPGLPRPRVILNLGARWLTKRWPPEHFAAIGRRAARTFGAGLIAVGAAERSAARQRPGSPSRPDAGCWTSAAGRDSRSSRPSASNPTWSSPTTPARSTWPRPPGRESSASTPARARSSRALSALGPPRSSTGVWCAPASARTAAASTACPSRPSSGRVNHQSSRLLIATRLRRGRLRAMIAAHPPGVRATINCAGGRGYCGVNRCPTSRWRKVGLVEIHHFVSPSVVVRVGIQERLP